VLNDEPKLPLPTALRERDWKESAVRRLAEESTIKGTPFDGHGKGRGTVVDNTVEGAPI
jgi:hypothetical protein